MGWLDDDGHGTGMEIAPRWAKLMSLRMPLGSLQDDIMLNSTPCKPVEDDRLNCIWCRELFLLQLSMKYGGLSSDTDTQPIPFRFCNVPETTLFDKRITYAITSLRTTQPCTVLRSRSARGGKCVKLPCSYLGAVHSTAEKGCPSFFRLDTSDSSRSHHPISI